MYRAASAAATGDLAPRPASSPRGDAVSPQEAGRLQAKRRRPWTRRPPSLSVVKERHPAAHPSKTRRAGRPPFAASGPADEHLLDDSGRGRGGGRLLLLPRTAGTALAGTDAELHELVAGEAEAPLRWASARRRKLSQAPGLTPLDLSLLLCYHIPCVLPE